MPPSSAFLHIVNTQYKSSQNVTPMELLYFYSNGNAEGHAPGSIIHISHSPIYSFPGRFTTNVF